MHINWDRWRINMSNLHQDKSTLLKILVKSIVEFIFLTKSFMEWNVQKTKIRGDCDFYHRGLEEKKGQGMQFLISFENLDDLYILSVKSYFDDEYYVRWYHITNKVNRLHVIVKENLSILSSICKTIFVNPS